MKTLIILVSLVFMVVGISLIASYNEVKETVNNATTTIFEPLNAIVDDPFYSFDQESYEKQAFSSIANIPIKFIEFERDLSAGAGTFFAGFALLLFATRDNLKEFTSKTLDFFIG